MLYWKDNISPFWFQVHVNEKKLIWRNGLEYHNYHQYLSTFMKSLKEIMNEYCFRLVSYNPNEVLGKFLSQSGQYYSYFDIVLSRE